MNFICHFISTLFNWKTRCNLKFDSIKRIKKILIEKIKRLTQSSTISLRADTHRMKSSGTAVV